VKGVAFAERSRHQLARSFGADRKIGHDVADQCLRQRRPVEKRRVDNLHTVQSAIVPRQNPVDDSPAPRLDDAERRGEGVQAAEIGSDVSRRQMATRLLNQLRGLVYFLDSHAHSVLDVTIREDRYVECQMLVRGERMIASRIDIDA